MRSIRLGLTVSAVAFVALALAVAPVLADTEAGHTGLTGTHSLRDTLDGPGATCVYKPAADRDVPLSLVRVRVNPPEVLARDLTPGTDRQRTGWRFIVERSNGLDLSAWAVVRRSGIQKAFATDLGAAPFTTMSVPIAPPTEAGHFRVKVKMFWYRNGRTEGTSTHIVDFYARKTPEGTDNFGPGGFCLDGLGN